MQNTYTGSGQQNNNNDAGTQNVSYGGGQMVVGEMNSNFVENFNITQSNPHKRLWDAIAGVGASHKAEQQFLRGYCLEGTRKEVLAIICEWILAKDQSLPICWLSGPAGVGKTAIAMSVAKSAEDSELVASFFFFRSDPRRNNPSALVLTIAHGLVVSEFSLKSRIERNITVNPMILEARLEEQFRELVVEPFTKGPVGWWEWFLGLWQMTTGSRPASKKSNLIIIDGLDECGDEDTQIRILSMIISPYQRVSSFPLRFLVCSRPESWIREAFRRMPLNGFSKQINLDESFHPDRDIKYYYLHAFKEIRERFENTRIRFPNPWPSAADLESLVQKSSGQFIYAVTAVKFIRLPCRNPIVQLLCILNYTPVNPSLDSSFSELDRLYHIILSLSPNHSNLLSILAAILIIPPHAPCSPEFIEVLFGIPTGEVDLTLRFMHSVINIQGGDVAISTYHTSFTDFLLDPSRSGPFHIDVAAHHETLAIQWLRTLCQQIAIDPNIVLNQHGASIHSAILHLRKGWAGFCFAHKRASTRLLVEIDNLLRSILSTFPNRQTLLERVASVVLLPSQRSSSSTSRSFALNELILGNGVSSTMNSLEACQLATPEFELRPFFLDFLCNPSQEYYIDIAQQYDHIARRWIQALTLNNQPVQ
ncbi:hypothetical protein AAF712_016232, partial [Marasmius tenuissimus]